MSSLSKVALAIAVSVAACSDTPVAPPQSQASASGSGSGIGGSVALSAPTDLRAADVGIGGEIVISWRSSSSGVTGYLVERAPNYAGPWSIHGFTTATNIGDAVVVEQRYCYRVAALSSSTSLNSPPSATLCISRSLQGVLTSVVK